jgi:hypothetical protein
VPKTFNAWHPRGGLFCWHPALLQAKPAYLKSVILGEFTGGERDPESRNLLITMTHSLISNLRLTLISG